MSDIMYACMLMIDGIHVVENKTNTFKWCYRFKYNREDVIKTHVFKDYAILVFKKYIIYLNKSSHIEIKYGPLTKIYTNKYGGMLCTVRQGLYILYDARNIVKAVSAGSLEDGKLYMGYSYVYVVTIDGVSKLEDGKPFNKILNITNKEC